MVRGSAERALPVLFIGGIGRSGTTVFELSLGTDSRIVALGEVIHLWQRSLIEGERCGCGSLFRECEFWGRVGDAAFGGWDQVDAARVVRLKRRIDRTIRTPQLATGLGGRKWKAEVREYASYYSKLYQAAVAISGADVVVDSSKQASLPYILTYAEDVDLKVIHCIRDSRAVAWSWTKKVKRPDSLEGGSEYMARYSPVVLAMKWMQHNAVIEGLRVLRIPRQRVRYEDWAEEPTSTVQAALQFAGLSRQHNSRLDDAWVDMPINHTCSGNPMRFKCGKVEIRRDEKWRTRLPKSSQFLVGLLTAPGLLAYGYLAGNFK